MKIQTVSGIFKPAGPPSDVSRLPAGLSCIVELRQAYDISGSLTGVLNIDFRIVVMGPCGAPPGTYEESWIAYGRYNFKIQGSPLKGHLSYIADVKAGGDVQGKIDLAGGGAGTIKVEGNFEEGMECHGTISY